MMGQSKLFYSNNSQEELKRQETLNNLYRHVSVVENESVQSENSQDSQEIELRYQGMLSDEENSKVEEYKSNRAALAGLGELMDI